MRERLLKPTERNRTEAILASSCAMKWMFALRGLRKSCPEMIRMRSIGPLPFTTSSIHIMISFVISHTCLILINIDINHLLSNASRILVTTAPKIELMCHVMRVLCIKRIRTRNYANSAEKMPRWKLARQKRQDSEFGEPCNQNFYKRNSLIHKDEEICRMLRSLHLFWQRPSAT